MFAAVSLRLKLFKGCFHGRTSETESAFPFFGDLWHDTQRLLHGEPQINVILFSFYCRVKSWGSGRGLHPWKLHGSCRLWRVMFYHKNFCWSKRFSWLVKCHVGDMFWPDSVQELSSNKNNRTWLCCGAWCFHCGEDKLHFSMYIDRHWLYLGNALAHGTFQ